MISTILAFWGLILIYTGFLASAAHVTTAIIATCTGLVLLAKPALEAARLFRTQFGGASLPGPRGGFRKQGTKQGTKQVYLKIVKSEDEKPTIH